MRSNLGDFARLLCLSLVVALFAYRPPKVQVVNETAYFQFDYPPNPETFTFQTSDPEVIAEARAVLAGQQEGRHIMGRIIKQPASYNPPWSYHLDPSTVVFFDMATEVCDATIAAVEAHLDEACGSFLPGCEWCPWGSRLLAEVTPGQEQIIFLPMSFR